MGVHSDSYWGAFTGISGEGTHEIARWDPSAGQRSGGRLDIACTIDRSDHGTNLVDVRALAYYRSNGSLGVEDINLGSLLGGLPSGLSVSIDTDGAEVVVSLSIEPLVAGTFQGGVYFEAKGSTL